MQNKFGKLFGILFSSIFVGIFIISIGFGAIFPVVNRVAKPFICPHGEMELDAQRYNPYPGKVVTTITWYCVDSTMGGRTELGIFPMVLYAGVIYGLGLFVLSVVGLYFYRIWEAMPKSEAMQKLATRIGNGILILFVFGIIAIGAIPWPQPADTSPTSSVVSPMPTVNSIASTFEALSSGTPIVFDSSEKPLAAWNNIPIMPEAIAGKANQNRYSFRVSVDTSAIETYYTETLKSMGWELVEHKFLGIEFTKDGSVLLVTLAPASDLQSWIVTLTLVSS